MDREMVFNLVSAVMNLAVIVFTVIAMADFTRPQGGSANMKVKRFECLKYFTVQSNLIAALTALLMLYFNIESLVTGHAAVPYWMSVFKFTGATAVMLTFTVVMTLLTPAVGLKLLLEGGSLYMHLITPLVAALTFIVFECTNTLDWYSLLFAIIPVVYYAILYFVMVVIVKEDRGGWQDFYGFNKGGKWYFSCVIVIGMAVGLAILIRFGHNAMTSAVGY